MQTSTQTFVLEFIEQIWNQRNFEKLSQYLHPNFKDHSLPPALPNGKEGIQSWIISTGKSFEHHTVIEDLVCDEEKIILKIRMDLKHIGIWRDMEATGITLQAKGYRFYKLNEGKISEHWALIDGQAIENQLRNASHGCKLVE